jgi:phenylacetate-CoA ligase
VWEDHFYPEVIDPETGAVLVDGERGELVFTSLTKEAFPIIRYRTRDLTRLLPGTARPGMRRMEKVTGRSDDMIILRGVNVFPTQIEEALLATDWCGGHFIIELTREGRMDEMTVLAEARPESWDNSGLFEQTEKLVHHIKSTIGITARIKAVAPETLERSLEGIELPHPHAGTIPHPGLRFASAFPPHTRFARGGGIRECLHTWS